MLPPPAGFSPRCGVRLPSAPRLLPDRLARLSAPLAAAARLLRSPDRPPSRRSPPARISRSQSFSPLRPYRSLAAFPENNISSRDRIFQNSQALQTAAAPARIHPHHPDPSPLPVLLATCASASAPPPAPCIPRSTTENHPSNPPPAAALSPFFQTAAASPPPRADTAAAAGPARNADTRGAPRPMEFHCFRSAR